jgi:hypothetical protein
MKRGRKFVAIIIAIVMMLTTLSIVSSAKTINTPNGSALAGFSVSGSNTVLNTTASATTSFGTTGGSVGVQATYYHFHTTTFVVNSRSGANGGHIDISISFIAPVDNRTLALVSDHDVRYLSETWTGRLSNTI